jgi:hypothetical protein
MRNIIQFPVTLQEKLDALDWAIQEALKTEAIGDVKAVALQEARKEVLREGITVPGAA